jgi:hypothetical protein
VGLIRAFVYWGLLARWTATVSESVSHAADGKTIRQNWLELAESSPPLAFKNAFNTGLEYRTDNPEWPFYEPTTERLFGEGVCVTET